MAARRPACGPAARCTDCSPRWWGSRCAIAVALFSEISLIHYDCDRCAEISSHSAASFLVFSSLSRFHRDVRGFFSSDGFSFGSGGIFHRASRTSLAL